MPAAAQSPQESGEAEVLRFIAFQQRKQAQARAEMEWRLRRRQELRENLAELCGFKHPVVSLQRVIAIIAMCAEHAAAMLTLSKTLSESEAAVRKAQKLLPVIAAQAKVVVRETVILQFRRPEGHR
jgi:hypothetical protein